MSTLQSSIGLTNHSLESFINQVTQTSNLCQQIHQLAYHPNIHTVSNTHQQLLELFLYGTYSDYKINKTIKLNDKQIHQLKRLTVFHIFEGQHEVSIDSIMQQLQMSRLEVYRVLTQMNTSGIISIKIDEKTGVCDIYSAPARLRRTYNDLAPSYSQRLQSIIKKNKNYLECLQLAKGQSKQKKYNFQY